MRSRLTPPLLALATFFLAGCVSFVTPAGTSISSTPPGARVVLDGRASGYLTPCRIALDTGDSHRLRLELPGYTPKEVMLVEGGDVYLIPWSAGYDMPYGWPFPLFLNSYDLFYPVRIDRGLSPDRVHLTLEPIASTR
ncbi:MAG: PEGA domain-containing protein [Planctomycetota bacterium]